MVNLGGHMIVSIRLRAFKLKSLSILSFVFLLLNICPNYAASYVSTPMDSGNVWKYLCVRIKENNKPYSDTFSITNTTITITKIERKASGYIFLAHWVDSTRTSNSSKIQIMDTIWKLQFVPGMEYKNMKYSGFDPFKSLMDSIFYIKGSSAPTPVGDYYSASRAQVMYNSDTILCLTRDQFLWDPYNYSSDQDSLVLLENYGVLVSKHNTFPYGKPGITREHCYLESFNNIRFKISEIIPLSKSVSNLEVKKSIPVFSITIQGYFMRISYPDPVSGGSIAIELIDMAGRKIACDKIQHNNEFTIDLPSMKAGIYMLRIKNGLNVWNKKFLFRCK